MWSAILAVALLSQFDGPGGGVTPEECLSVGGGTLGGNLHLKDDIKILFGTDTNGDSAIYSDGADTYWLLQEGAANSGLTLSFNSSPPAPADSSVLIYGTDATSAACDSTTMLCLERAAAPYIDIVSNTNQAPGIRIGDSSSNVAGRLQYRLSGTAAPSSAWRFIAAGTVFMDAMVGSVEHKQATVYSTTAGDLGHDPAGELTQGPATEITTTYDDRNGFAKVCTTTEETLTFASGAGDADKTTSGLIPDGATAYAVAAYVVTTGTTCTSADYGDGLDVDLYGDNIGVTAGSDVTGSDYTATLNYNATTAEEVTITGVGGNCVDMVVRVVAHYCTFTAPTN